MEKVSSLSILSEDWVLSSDRAQQLGSSAQKTKELNEFLALMRGRICEEQSSRMKVTIQENGCTLITIPEFDGRELRDRLQMGITAIAGRAANAILKAVEARADADFAGIGASSMELQFANTGTESAPRYRVMRTITYREPGKAPAGPPLLPAAATLEDAVSVGRVTDSAIDLVTGDAVDVTVVSITSTSESSTFPSRYAHLLVAPE
jgi:hypothetical protein